ncbi:MAG: hypothetical protein AAFV95_14525 [Bacteroidota bacterium]
MKHLLSSLVVIFLCASLSAQDTITFQKGGKKEVRIVNIKDGLINFYFWDDPDKKRKEVPVESVADYFMENTRTELSNAVETSGDVREIYCHILGRSLSFSRKFIVSIDFGLDAKSFAPYLDDILHPRTGKTKRFDTMLDALNYLSVEHGWSFVTAYTTILDGETCWEKWLLKKEIRLPKQTADQAKLGARN